MQHPIGRELPAKTLVVAIDCGKVIDAIGRWDTAAIQAALAAQPSTAG